MRFCLERLSLLSLACCMYTTWNLDTSRSRAYPPFFDVYDHPFTQRSGDLQNHLMGGSKIWVPQNGWLIMENPIKMNDFGVSLFSETHHITNRPPINDSFQTCYAFPGLPDRPHEHASLLDLGRCHEYLGKTEGRRSGPGPLKAWSGWAWRCGHMARGISRACRS